VKIFGEIQGMTHRSGLTIVPFTGIGVRIKPSAVFEFAEKNEIDGKGRGGNGHKKRGKRKKEEKKRRERK
jgi:hypothetical protein